MLETTVAQILAQKEVPEIFSVSPQASLRSAALLMARHGVGSLVVVERGVHVGILSERECVRRGIALGRNVDSTVVSEVMDEDFVTVDPQATVERCFQMMTTFRARHLLVDDSGELIGIISIGDVVKSLIADQIFVIDELERYIHGEYAFGTR